MRLTCRFVAPFAMLLSSCTASGPIFEPVNLTLKREKQALKALKALKKLRMTKDLRKAESAAKPATQNKTTRRRSYITGAYEHVHLSPLSPMIHEEQITEVEVVPGAVVTLSVL